MDGPLIWFYGAPFSTRMTLVRLSDGGLIVHAPIAVSEPLIARVQALGPIHALVAPNQIHYAPVGAWQVALPDVETCAAPGVPPCVAQSLNLRTVMPVLTTA